MKGNGNFQIRKWGDRGARLGYALGPRDSFPVRTEFSAITQPLFATLAAHLITVTFQQMEVITQNVFSKVKVQNSLANNIAKLFGEQFFKTFFTDHIYLQQVYINERKWV